METQTKCLNRVGRNLLFFEVIIPSTLSSTTLLYFSISFPPRIRLEPMSSFQLEEKEKERAHIKN